MSLSIFVVNTKRRYDIGKPPVVEKNTDMANTLFAVAADRGDPEAMFYLAWGCVCPQVPAMFCQIPSP